MSLEGNMTNKVEHLAAKLVGTAKAAKATFEGLEGVFRHLEREHGEVSALLMRLKLSSDPDMRRELWPTIRRELLSHEQAELQEVYPALRENPDTRDMAEEHEQDAEGLQEVIDELTATAVDSDQWQPTLERLIAQVQEHVRDEEEEYFPIADRAFKDRSDNMLKRYELAKTEAMRQLSATP
jgi:hemerythrin superfamily protein